MTNSGQFVANLSKQEKTILTKQNIHFPLLAKHLLTKPWRSYDLSFKDDNSPY